MPTATPRIDLRVANALRAATLQQTRQSVLKDGGLQAQDATATATIADAETLKQGAALTKGGKVQLDKALNAVTKEKADDASKTEDQATDEVPATAVDAADVGSVLTLLAGHAVKAATDGEAKVEKGAKGAETTRTTTSAAL